MRPNPTCPVCDHGATDAASIRVHNDRCAEFGERSYPLGRNVTRQVFPAIPVERPAAWLNREFGAFAPAIPNFRDFPTK